MKQEVHFSDLSAQQIQDPGAMAVLHVHEHPDLEQGVRLEVLPEEVADIGKTAIKPVVVEVILPDEEDSTTYTLTAANFKKLATGKPMNEVLENAEPLKRVARRAGGVAMNGEVRDHNVVEFAGSRHKGRTSPQEAHIVRTRLLEVNTNLASRGERLVDPHNTDHQRRYGLNPDDFKDESTWKPAVEEKPAEEAAAAPAVEPK